MHAIVDREIANPMTVRTKLTIYNLTLDDYGTYTCVVHSPFGMERGSTELVREWNPLLFHSTHNAPDHHIVDYYLHFRRKGKTAG